MEILFVNKYIRDEEWVKDAHRYIFFRRPILIFCYVYEIVALLYGLYNLIFNGYIISYSIIIPLLMFVFMFVWYKRSVKITLQRDIEVSQKPIEVSAMVTNEAIMQIDSLGGNHSLKFYNIKKAVHTKKYIYIITNAKLMYTFKNDGFTVGDKDRFLDFLRMKGVRVK